MNMDGVNKLGRLFQEQMNKTADKPLVLDFGVIQEDYSLLTNTFPLPIPVDDYVVCRCVTYNPSKPLTMTWWAGESPTVKGWEKEDWSKKGWQGGDLDKHEPPDTIPSHGHGPKGESDVDCGIHYHDIYVPDKMRWLKPNDRVLVAWVQNDAVIIDIILAAKGVFADA